MGMKPWHYFATITTGSFVFLAGYHLGKVFCKNDLRFREQTAAVLGYQFHILNNVRFPNGQDKSYKHAIFFHDWLLTNLHQDIDTVLIVCQEQNTKRLSGAEAEAAALFAPRIQNAIDDLMNRSTR